MMVIEEVMPFDGSAIDRSISAEDLTLWAQFRFTLYMTVGSSMPFVAEA